MHLTLTKAQFSELRDGLVLNTKLPLTFEFGCLGGKVKKANRYARVRFAITDVDHEFRIVSYLVRFSVRQTTLAHQARWRRKIEAPPGRAAPALDRAAIGPRFLRNSANSRSNSFFASARVSGLPFCAALAEISRRFGFLDMARALPSQDGVFPHDHLVPVEVGPRRTGQPCDLKRPLCHVVRRVDYDATVELDGNVVRFGIGTDGVTVV